MIRTIEEAEAAIASLSQQLSTLNASRAATGNVGRAVATQIGQLQYASPEQWRPEVLLANQSTMAYDTWVRLDLNKTDLAEGAQIGLIQFEAEATADVDILELFWRTAEGATEVRTVRIGGDEDDAQPRLWYPVVLYSKGFECKALKGGGTPNFAIRYQGFRMT